ncbi:MAG: DcaP family trimeric outer membrane transporter [Pseudomonadota bacterium]
MRFQTLWQMPLLLGVAATSIAYSAGIAPAGPVAAVAAPAPIVAAAPAAVSAAGTVDTATLMKQIEELKKQVAHVAYKQRKSEEKLESEIRVDDAKIGVLQANQVSAFPTGFIAVPGTNSAIKIGGRIKADGAYYPRSNANAKNIEFDGTVIPLRNQEVNAAKSGFVQGGIANSRIEFTSLSHTNQGDVKGWIQTDFDSSLNLAGGPNNYTGTSYVPRIRHAIVEWKSLTVGQTLTNFHDSEGVTTLDNNGLGNVVRRVQVKWTEKLGEGLSLSVAAENPNTDYVTQNGATGNNSNLGKSGLPDLTARLRLEGKQGFVSLRGIVRRLEVNVQPTEAAGGVTALNQFANKQTGWGLGTSFKLITSGLSGFNGQVTFGDGINNFLAVESLPSAYLQLPASATPAAGNNGTHTQARFDTLSGASAILGYEHWWTDQFRTTIAGSYTKVKNSSFAPVSAAGSQLNSRLKKAVVNAIYSPVKQMDIGVEVMYGTRETIGGTVDTAGTNAPVGSQYAGGTGRATQIMTSFIYKF